MTSGQWDVVVIGGGPAGAAAAIAAQNHGCRVLLLEAAYFPRHHVGESLVGMWPVFEALGVTDDMDVAFQHKSGSCRVWGREPALKWTEFEALPGGRRYSLQVERSLFDLILLRRAEAVGATVWQGHRVEAVLWEGERAIGVRYRTPEGERHDVRARWVIDASGRAGLIARTRGLRAVDRFYPDMSVYGYFRHARRFPGEHDGNLLIEAVPWGWLWFIPLHTGEISVGLVCDGSSRAELRAEGRVRYLRAMVDRSIVVRDLLAPAELAKEPIVTASYGYASARYAGSGWLLAGDAGSFVDPMWATGVANALGDGLLAAAVVEAATSGRVGEDELIAFYDREARRRADRVLALVKFVYRVNHIHGDQPFWKIRHEWDMDGSASAGAVLDWLSRDPSIRYFRDAFAGMGLDEGELVPMDAVLRRRARRDHDAAALLGDLAGWVPVLADGVHVRRGLGLLAGRIVHGVVAQAGEIEEFTGDPCVGAALQLIDGQRTAREVVDASLAAASAGSWLAPRFQVAGSLVQARDHGLLRARAAVRR